MQSVVAVINSAAVAGHFVEQSVQILQEAGFLIVEKKRVVLTQPEAEAFAPAYAEKYLSGPVETLLLSHPDAFNALAKLKDDLEGVYTSDDEYTALRDRCVLYPQKPLLERCVVVLKPGYTADDIKLVSNSLAQEDFVLLAQVQKTLSKAEAQAIVLPKTVDEEKHIEYLTSGDSVAFLVERLGALDTLQLLLGPEDPIQARAKAPGSLRAFPHLGQSILQNGIHGSRTVESAQKEAASLFSAALPVERTLALLYPHVFGQEAAILDLLREHAFTVTAREELYLTKARAEEWHLLSGGEPQDKHAAAAILSSGPSVALVLSRPAAIRYWQSLAGPEDMKLVDTKPNSLRARFGKSQLESGFYASAEEKSAERDIKFFFPQLSGPIDTNLAQLQQYLASKPSGALAASQPIGDILVQGLTQMCKERPQGLEAVRWLGNWLLSNNPNKPKVEEPAEFEANVPASEKVHASLGPNQHLEVLFCIGAPDVGLDSHMKLLEQVHQYSAISVHTLLQRAADDLKSERSEPLRAAIRNGRDAPSALVVELIAEEILARPNKHARYALLDFPSKLDHALEFEQQLTTPSALILFESEQSVEIARSSDDKTTLFYDAVLPVLDHYRLFNKLRVVPVSNGSISAKVAHQQLQQALQLSA